MKIKFLTCLLIFLFALPLAAAPPMGLGGKSAPSKALLVDNASFIDVNRIYMFITNHGNFGRDLAGVFGNDYGTYYPYAGTDDIIDGSNIRSPYYAGGLWMGALDSATIALGEGDPIRIIVAEYSDEYVPGPIDTINDTAFADDRTFRVYKLFRDSLEGNENQDYLDWPADQGAPVDDEGKPAMVGDQMCWAVYNDMDPDQHSNRSGETPPLGIEVRQTTFAFDRQGSLGSIIFLKFQVFNKSNNVLTDCFFSIWSDPDLGGSGDDLVGCDTTIDLGYVYNETNSDQYYGSSPPCLGIDFFQGPLIATGDNADTALMWNDTLPGYVNMGMTSFNKYINGTDPRTRQESYNYMQGLNKDGTNYQYPAGIDQKYVHSGDPVAFTGDLDAAGDDRRWMQTTGPYPGGAFRPGDSTEILAAIIIGQGSDRLSSITVMKELDKFAQKLYESGFNPPPPPAKPNVTVARLSGEITLSWDDTSEVDQGEFPFEGYSVWQAPAKAGPWTLLRTWDLDNHIDSLTDVFFDVESGLFLAQSVRALKNQGLQYHYTTKIDKMTNEPLRDAQDYYFRVTAFSFSDTNKIGEAVPNGDKFLESQTIVQVTPQAELAGETSIYDSEDVVPADHETGVSGGQVLPIVKDPFALTGHEYRVTFVDTPGIKVDTTIIPHDPPDPPDTILDSIDIAWFLYDIDADTMLLEWQTNQTGNEDYFVIDGMLLKVTGPPLDFLSFFVVENGAGPVIPPEPGAFGFRDFPVGGLVDEDGDPANPSALQQVGDGRWGFHIYDNGGTSGGGTNGPYSEFLYYTTRCDQGCPNLPFINSYDFEMRFTGDNADPGTGGSWAYEWIADPVNAIWVPFELWNIGIGTPEDPSDDVRMVIKIIDDAGDAWEGDDIYALESWGVDSFWVNPLDPADSVYLGGGDLEHSASGGDDDPYTDWVYWTNPADMSPGEAGYQAFEDSLTTGATIDAADVTMGAEVLARTVLVNWNGGILRYKDTDGNLIDTTDDGDPLTFTQDCPEMGTIFRLSTTKPNTMADTFFFTPQALDYAANEKVLDKIKAVPNPFYLFGPYDPAPGKSVIRFHHLPEKCTISIYNLGGDLVQTIDKNDASTAVAEWNAQTELGLPVASGIYIYVVDAPGFGTKIGKMAVFTESEVLDLF